MKTSHSNKEPYRFEKETVNTHDIFYGEHYDYNGVKMGHYFYCIHTQEEDANNSLFRDVTGLLITTKPAPGYSCEIEINGRVAYVCCDREIRFMAEVGRVQVKYFKPTEKERREVLKCHKKFQKEKIRQMKKGLKVNAKNTR